jgi:hypothetical protein
MAINTNCWVESACNKKTETELSKRQMGCQVWGCTTHRYGVYFIILVLFLQIRGHFHYVDIFCM